MAVRMGSVLLAGSAFPMPGSLINRTGTWTRPHASITITVVARLVMAVAKPFDHGRRFALCVSACPNGRASVYRRGPTVTQESPAVHDKSQFQLILNPPGVPTTG